MDRKIIVFDLDDTLYKEIDFLKSGYQQISIYIEKLYGLSRQKIFDDLLKWYQKGENPFLSLIEKYNLNNPIQEFLDIYRFHHPDISLSQETTETLSVLKEYGAHLAIITDGRKETQKNKIESLGLFEWIAVDDIIINENKADFKPSPISFEKMMIQCHSLYPFDNLRFFYVADNTAKDFIAPNQLGWTSVCILDDGRNIHKQSFDLLKEYLPKYRIDSIKELSLII